MKNSYLILVILLVLQSCKTEEKETTKTVEVAISTIGNGIERLASDDFQGRMPFTEGETKTINYLKDEFVKLGLEPGNGDSYFQDVPMVEITGKPSEKMVIFGGKKEIN